MRREYYKMLINPSTKHVANKAIQTELSRITDENNIVNFVTDPKENSIMPYIRTTVFVHDTNSVNFNHLGRVEERLKKLFGKKFKTVFCNANLTPNESLLLSSVSGENTISFIDLENFTSNKWSDIECEESIENLILETLRLGHGDSIVICANKHLVSLANKVLKQYEDNSSIILIQTRGKDCSDLRLVQSIQKLSELKKIDAFTKINIVSGDGFFESIIKRLENKDFNLAIYGQEGKTHHKLVEHKNYVPLNNYNLAS
jgi:hypothetical protein